jgi:hypothetical protein
MTDDEIEREDEVEQQAGRLADAAWDRVTQTWNDWLTIGEWFGAARTNAMREARANEPKGRGYNEAFSRRLQQRKFHNMDQGDRKRLFECMENRVAIEAWRQTLTLGERQRYNHPSTVLRKWKASTTVPAPKGTSPMTKMKEAVRVAEERAYVAEERAKRAGSGSNVDFENDKIPNIARVIADGLIKASKVRQLINALRKEATRLEKQGG